MKSRNGVRIVKKLKCLLLVLIIYTSIPLNVFADCGMSPLDFEAVINNHNGAKVFDENGNVESTIEYGKKVTVGYVFDGYAEVYDDTVSGSIKIEDLTFAKDIKNNTKSEKYYVYADTELRDKPVMKDYNVLETIPTGTEIDVYDDEGSGFAVVKYNGKTGYVYVASCYPEGAVTLFPKKGIKEKPITAFAYKLYEFKEDKNDFVSGIPYGYKIIGDESTKITLNIAPKEKVEILYSVYIGHNEYSYIKTDKIDGIWVEDALLLEEKNEKYVLNYDPDWDNDNVEIEDFNSLKKVNVNLDKKMYDIKYFIIGNEGIGYVIENDNKLYTLFGYRMSFGTVLYKDVKKVELDSDTKYYDSTWFDDDYTLKGKIEIGTYEGYECVDNFGEKNDIYFIPNYGYIKYIDNEKVTPNNKINVKDYTSYIVLGTVGVSLLAGITIYLLNKGKKNKENESK